MFYRILSGQGYNPNPKNCMFVLHVVGLRDGAILFIRHGCGMGGIHVHEVFMPYNWNCEYTKNVSHSKLW